ncbi:hypothetical protein DL93DRAFT_2203540 [Clavulina sp. PMI_390]|nr:hypothetical protein DL93DRAFT_2203540 [Clavulina sp. PMI_390]
MYTIILITSTPSYTRRTTAQQTRRRRWVLTVGAVEDALEAHRTGRKRYRCPIPTPSHLQRAHDAPATSSTATAPLSTRSHTTIATHATYSGVAASLCSYDIDHDGAPGLQSRDRLERAHDDPTTDNPRDAMLVVLATTTTPNDYDPATASSGCFKPSTSNLRPPHQSPPPPAPLQRRTRRPPASRCHPSLFFSDNNNVRRYTTPHRPERTHDAPAVSPSTTYPPMITSFTTTATRVTPSGVSASLCFLFNDNDNAQRPQPRDRLEQAHDEPAAFYATILPPSSPPHTTTATHATLSGIAAFLRSSFSNDNDPQLLQLRDLLKQAHDATATSSTTIAPPVTSPSTTAAMHATPSGVAVLLPTLTHPAAVFWSPTDAAVGLQPVLRAANPTAQLTSECGRTANRWARASRFWRRAPDPFFFVLHASRSAKKYAKDNDGRGSNGGSGRGNGGGGGSGWSVGNSSSRGIHIMSGSADWQRQRQPKGATVVMVPGPVAIPAIQMAMRRVPGPVCGSTPHVSTSYFKEFLDV